LEPDLKAPKTPPWQRKKKSRLAALGTVFANLAAILVVLGLATLVLPKHLNPFYPLKASDPIGPLTKWKLQGLALDGAACKQFLTDAGVTFTPVPERREQGFCGVKNGVRMTSGGPPLYPNSPQMSCSVAAGLVIWERQALARTALDMMGSKVTRIDHLGTYNCRRQYGRKTGWISEHASANAIDIAGFQFADGQKVTVLEGWKVTGGQSTQVANFLAKAQDRACHVFKVVLGPEANAAHENHFHFDMGPMSSCR
jgi:hypothetical protein